MVDILDLIPGLAGHVLREQKRQAVRLAVALVKPFGEGAAKASRTLGQARRGMSGAQSSRVNLPVRMSVHPVSAAEAQAINQRHSSMLSRLERTRSGPGYTIRVRRKR